MQPRADPAAGGRCDSAAAAAAVAALPGGRDDSAKKFEVGRRGPQDRVQSESTAVAVAVMSDASKRVAGSAGAAAAPNKAAAAAAQALIRGKCAPPRL